MKLSTKTIAFGLALAFVIGFVAGMTVTPDKANAQVAGSSVGAGNYFRLLSNVVSTVTSSMGFSVGSTTPNAKLLVQGTSGSTSDVFNVASSTGASLLNVDYDGTVNVPGNIVISGTCTGCSAGLTGSALTAGNFLVGNAGGLLQATSSIFISPVGRIGIATTTPGSMLSVFGSLGSQTPLFNVASTTGANTFSDLFTILANGKVGVATSTPAYTVDVNGELRVGTAGANDDTFLANGTTGVVSIQGSTLTVNGNTTLNDWFDQSVKQAASPTFAGLALGSGNLTMTGSLAATGARVTKGWFTDVESTNMFTVGGTSLSSTFGSLAGTNSWSGKNSFGTPITSIETNGRINVAAASTTPQRGIVYSTAACAEATLTDGATVTWDLSASSCARVLLGGNRTLDITNAEQAIGQTVRLVACANGGAYSFTGWDAAIRWPAKTAPTQTATANSCDVFSGFVSAGTSTPIVILGASLNF